MEDDGKKDIIESVKNNLFTNRVEHHQEPSTENTQVTVDAEKQKLMISKFGKTSIAIKATEHLPTPTMTKSKS